jgi:hypothetical protein
MKKSSKIFAGMVSTVSANFRKLNKARIVRRFAGVPCFARAHRLPARSLLTTMLQSSAGRAQQPRLCENLAVGLPPA